MGIRRRKYLSKRFWLCRAGASAVEFAIVAPLFLALTFSVIEAGYFYFIEAAVDAANAKAARLIRTGQAQNSSMTREAFFGEICKVVKLFGDCNTELTVDVQRFNSFAALAADASQTICRDADPNDVNNIPYDSGAARDIVRVRVCFLHKGVNPGLGLNLQKAKGGDVKIISTSIFRNEPFES